MSFVPKFIDACGIIFMAIKVYWRGLFSTSASYIGVAMIKNNNDELQNSLKIPSYIIR